MPKRVQPSEVVPIKSLKPSYQQIAMKAVDVATRAYSPYSKFSVGASMLHPDNTSTEGCNWENCIYQSTCAERCAIVCANAVGKRTAVAIAVYGFSTDPSVPCAPPLSVVTPCGLCRQMLGEVGQLSCTDMDIVMISADQEHAVVEKLSKLLPMSFGPSNVGLDVRELSKGTPPATPVRPRKTSRPAE